MLSHQQPSSQPVSEGLHNLESVRGDDSDTRDESLPYGVCRFGIAFLSLPGIRVITAITLGETMLIRNREYAQQIKDFSGLRYGPISPSDIDCCLEFNNKLILFIECKYGTTPLPTGQRIMLERLSDNCKIPCVVIVCNHNFSGDIDMANTTVTAYRENANWFTDVPEVTLREMIDIFRRKYLG